MSVLKAFLVAGMFFLISGCSKQNDNDIPRVGNYATVPFSTGYIGNRAVYWIGKEAVYLTEDSQKAAGRGIFILDNDIYVSGYLGADPCYWKNGTIHLLPTNGKSGVARSIYVINNKIYVAGVINHDQTSNAAMWVDDKLTILDEGPSVSMGADISVSNGSVYVAGYTMLDGHLRACIWKNGVLQLMPFKTDDNPNSKNDGSTSEGIFTDKKDVYITGQEYHWNVSETAAYWKGNKLVYLENNVGAAVGESIFKRESDIYVCGYQYSEIQRAAYWKNNRIKLLSNHPSEARAIVAGKDHVYIVGNEFANGVQMATSWIDGQVFHMSEEESEAYDVKLGRIWVNF
ncbi:hypothetical protein [Arachidicoccus terrestris]|uniref:hypothetical protein n=1 Tax=Arachidicoccus terrestris TaxID=2875539 RepID=UPI001CC7F555|nr:hypothetical protein [Arachidicoccus terrestris]UAY56884.1 hypothetical protein K9M52_07810 [Arachidicoccus terrestris]